MDEKPELYALTKQTAGQCDGRWQQSSGSSARCDQISRSWNEFIMNNKQLNSYEWSKDFDLRDKPAGTQNGTRTLTSRKSAILRQQRSFWQESESETEIRIRGSEVSLQFALAKFNATDKDRDRLPKQLTSDLFGFENDYKTKWPMISENFCLPPIIFAENSKLLSFYPSPLFGTEQSVVIWQASTYILLQLWFLMFFSPPPSSLKPNNNKIWRSSSTAAAAPPLMPCRAFFSF